MASNPLAEKRGPKIGDAASLWNFTPSPGWTKEEVQILRLCLMKHGIGRWIQILEEGLLPGKLIQQLNGQTQRLLGQQSLVAYSGLQVDVDRIRADNEARTDVERKAGLIINTGPNLTKQMKEKLKEEARIKYGLAPEQVKEIEEKIEEVRASLNLGGGAASGSGSGSGAAKAPGVGLLSADPSTLNKEQKMALLKRLHSTLQAAHAQLQKATQAGAQQAQQQEQPPAAAAAAPAKQAAPRPTNSNAENQPAAANTDSMEVDPPSSTADAGAQQAQRPTSAGTAKPAKAGGGKRKAGASGGIARKARAPKNSSVDSDGEWEPEAGGQRGGKGRGRRQSSVGDVEMEDREASGSVNAANLRQLQDMGFPAKQSALALEECGGDLEAALEWLAENCL